MEIERKDTMANTCIIKLPRHKNVECSETISQKGVRMKDT